MNQSIPLPLDGTFFYIGGEFRAQWGGQLQLIQLQLSAW